MEFGNTQMVEQKLGVWLKRLDKQKRGVWLKQYLPPSPKPQHLYLPKKARTDLVCSVINSSTANSLTNFEDKCISTVESVWEFCAERTVANLRIAWEININKMANVCSREFALHTVLKNCSYHFLEF